ncbi:MAG: DMT family transporter [Bdellovibrionaceae bacterium]|nr:DMT family transporter [Pseudobdellovibrionaceae bacterium]
MDKADLAVFYALAASLAFAGGSVFFARYSRRISSIWMNTVKALTCGVGLSLTLAILGIWDPFPNTALYGLLLSGALGLGIGDLFLLGAFSKIGASRSLLIFGFQPLIMAVAGSVLFQQALLWNQGLALIFFIFCLVTLSLERYRLDGHWEIKGLLFAFIGVLLDNVGVLLTRFSFDLAPDLNPLQANLFRIGGALGVFLVLSFFIPLQLFKNFASLPVKDRFLAVGASLIGTFVSLSLYLNALKYGHLAILSGVVLTGPLFSALIESLIQKKRPSNYQIIAFICLLAGMGLVFAQK